MGELLFNSTIESLISRTPFNIGRSLISCFNYREISDTTQVVAIAP
jgi:hypothetical protein